MSCWTPEFASGRLWIWGVWSAQPGVSPLQPGSAHVSSRHRRNATGRPFREHSHTHWGTAKKVRSCITSVWIFTLMNTLHVLSWVNWLYMPMTLQTGDGESLLQSRGYWERRQGHLPRPPIHQGTRRLQPSSSDHAWRALVPTLLLLFRMTF